MASRRCSNSACCAPPERTAVGEKARQARRDSPEAPDEAVPCSGEAAGGNAKVGLDCRADQDEPQQNQENRGDGPEQIAIKTEGEANRRDEEPRGSERCRDSG